MRGMPPLDLQATQPTASQREASPAGVQTLEWGALFQRRQKGLRK